MYIIIFCSLDIGEYIIFYLDFSTSGRVINNWLLLRTQMSSVGLPRKQPRRPLAAIILLHFTCMREKCRIVTWLLIWTHLPSHFCALLVMLIILHFRTIAYVLKEIMDHLPPLYLNHLSRYNDIAKYGFFANEIHGPSVEVPPSKNESSTPDSKNLTDKPTDRSLVSTRRVLVHV